MRYRNNQISLQTVAIWVLLFGGSLCLTYFSAPALIFGHDFSSYLLLAKQVGTEHAPYETYFDIKPPFLIYSVALWIKIFGEGFVSLYLLNALVLFFTFSLFREILRRLTNEVYANLITCFAIIQAFATRIYSEMFFTSETFGLLMVLISVELMSRSQINTKGYVAAGLFFGFSSQIKEVYIFAVLGALIYFIFKLKVRAALLIFLGFTAAQLLIFSLLLADGALFAYLEVLSYKSEVFPIPNIDELIRLTFRIASGSEIFGLSFNKILGTYALITAFSLKVLRKPKSAKIERLQESLVLFTLLFLALCLGFSWQGKPLEHHYAITIVLPYLIICAVSIYLLLTITLAKAGNKTFLGFLIILIFLMPHELQILKSYMSSLGRIKSEVKELEFSSAKYSKDFKLLTDSVAVRTSANDCIQIAYGWGTATILNTVDRPSCTRYFLPNLINSEKNIATFKNEIENSLPKLIIYNTAWADQNIEDFESTVFPYSKVIANCYTLTSTNFVYELHKDVKSLYECK